MPFTETLAQLPFTPRTAHASGFIPPMLRAMGHLLFLASWLADTDQTPPTDEQVLAELTHARDHWNARAETGAVSTAVVARAATIRQALEESVAEYANWTPEQRTGNLRDLAHRIVQYSADLDRELVGLRDSDPGTSL